VDFFGVGEHHTDYFPMPAGDVVLAAIAARTERIHLGSAVTVLSSDDPVRVFQRYSTLNALSAGRAEVILGRGSSIESFPLFGYDLADYEDLFEEKATLFAELLEGGPVTWTGKTRAPLLHQDVVPHTDEQAKAEFWPRWRDLITRVAAERGFRIPTEASFEAETGPRGALYVGSPETVARKINVVTDC
jgi:alkanesulfonate monooxygenase SsuD/methylene tetrahydromethanopterin reductase-like flavin-dependent oxidoreductase (luciferase family)